MRPINKIIIQLVEVRNADALIAEQKEKGMPEVGFHYMIEQDGSVIIGRSISIIGNHLLGHNAYSIGIACIGDQLTKKHEFAIDELLEELSIKGVETSSVFYLEKEELINYK